MKDGGGITVGWMDKKEKTFWTLDTLPAEVFLHVCSFIDAGFLIHRMSLVCKKFHLILSNEQTWKIRQIKRWGDNGSYPPVPVDESEFPWSRACVKREEQIRLWGNNGSNLRNVEVRAHIACVDAVHLFEGGRYLASGSRDRSIVIWDVEKCFSNPGEAKVGVMSGSHRGWIWSLASNSNHLFSASWDTTVKVWDRKSDFRLITEYATKAACLSLSAMENLVACGTCKKVLLFDPRSGTQPVTAYKAHKKAVLALGLDGGRVISGGEDGKIVSLDLRTKKIRTTLSLPEPKSYPTCLSFRREDPVPLFYVGTSIGNLHLISSTELSLVKSYNIGHSRSVQGVFHGLGSVFTCSRDGNMKIFEPSSGLHEIASYHIKEELPAVHSLYNIVALADADGIIRIWAPRESF